MTTPPEGGPTGEGVPSSLRGEPSPLHGAAVWIWTLEAALPLLVVLVITGVQPLVGMGGLGALVLLNVVRYRRYRWRLEPDALVIDKGLIRRRRRIIRRDRIQTVDLERGIRHRLLGVVEVRVEAIGSAGTEGKLAALDPVTAEALRRVLLARPAPTSVPEDAGPIEPLETLARVGPGSLVLAGLTGGRVGVAAAVVGFLLQFIPEERFVESLEPWLAEAPDPTPAVILVLMLALVGLALVAGFILSVVATVVVHWNFTLSREGGTLWVQRGLLTQHRDSVPLHRIQAVRVEENLVRRALGIASVRAVVAGRAGAGEDGGADLLLPVGRREAAFELARQVIGVADGTDLAAHRMPGGARDRRLVRAAIAGLLAAAATLIGLGATWDASWTARIGVALLGGLTVGGVATALALASYRALGWNDFGTHLLVRDGVVNRRSSLVPVGRLQEVSTRTSPFQRRRRLATLHLRIARPVAKGFTPRALDMGEEVAAELRDRLPARIADRW